MKKPFQSCFLFMAQHPTGLLLIPFLSIWFIIMIVLLLIDMNNGFSDLSPKTLSVLNWHNFVISLGPVLFLILLNYLVMHRYITRPNYYNDNYRNFWFLIFVDKQNKPTILNKPIWNKGKVFIVRAFKNNYSYFEKELVFETTIDGKYKNAVVKIPVTLSLILDGPFEDCDKIKIFEILYNYSSPEKENELIDLESYIIKKFKSINSESLKVVGKIVNKYAEQKITEPKLLSKVIDLLVFPEKPIPNVADVNICLSEPIHSSCKGMSCGS